MDPSTLRDRLRDIVRSPTAAAGGIASMGSERPSADAPSLGGVLGGVWQGAESARSFAVVRRTAPEQLYGTRRVGAFAARLRDAAAGASVISAAADAPFLF